MPARSIPPSDPELWETEGKDAASIRLTSAVSPDFWETGDLDLAVDGPARDRGVEVSVFQGGGGGARFAYLVGPLEWGRC